MQSKTKYYRIMLFSLLSGIALTLSCGSGGEVELSNSGEARRLVIAAKKDIAVKKYSEAQEKCQKAEKLDASYVEAPYCVLVANLGALVQTASSIISLLTSQLPAPAYTAASVCISSRVLDGQKYVANNCGVGMIYTVISDLEGQMAYIDQYAYKLAKMNNPTFHIDDFPLAIDPTDVLKLANVANLDRIQIKGSLAINLRGTWDISEVVALAASVNTVQGAFDYLLSHSLILDNADLGKGTEGFAKFLASNPKLFTEDPANTGRLTGDDTHKGSRNDFLSALSYAIGRTDDLERVAPANGGWTAAIRQSAANQATDAVMKFMDTDGDGIPEKIAIPALAELKDSVRGIEIDAEFTNPLSVKTWRAILKTGEGLRDNIENGGKSVPLQNALAGIAGDLRADHPTSRLLALNKPVPNLLAINAAKFLDHPKTIRKLIPYYFSYLTSTTTPIYDLAFEKEVFQTPSTNQIEKIGHVYGAALDFAHFSYPVSVEVGAGIVAHDFSFDDFKSVSVTSLLISPDAVTATAKYPELFYIALQDPSFGGLLELNPNWPESAPTAEFAPPNRYTLNKALNHLIQYYCLNTAIKTEKDDVDPAGIVDDTNAAYASNRIADCQ